MTTLSSLRNDGRPPVQGGGHRLAGILLDLERLAEGLGAPDLALRAREAREPLEKGEIRVVVVGQFKRGKSTLLNALVGQPVLPTGMVPVTSVVTEIRWSPGPEVRVVFRDGNISHPPLSGLREFVSERGNPGNRKGVQRVEVGLPTPLLEGGLVLVDTPGIGSTDPGATERAYAFLSRVDAALVVLSPDPPLGEGEARYIQELLAHTPHALFVLTKVDLFPEAAWREALAFDREVLARALDLPPEQVRILPVSAVAGSAGWHDGSLDQLRHELMRLGMERREGVSQDVAVRRLGQIAEGLAARLEVGEKAIRMSRESLEDRLRRLGDLRRDLALRRSEVQPVLLDAARRLAEDVGDALRREAQARRLSLIRSLEERLRDGSGQGNGALTRSISVALAEGVTALFEGWWSQRGGEAKARLREAMERAAKGVDATGSTLASWVADELGVVLPTPPPPLDLVESHDFYYHVAGVSPELTVDLLLLLLPPPWFRRWLRRRLSRLVEENLELNVGRTQGDLLYRAQETVRAFFAELNRRALEAEEGIQTALLRALEIRAGLEVEGAKALEELAEARARLEEILAMAPGAPALAGVFERQEGGGRESAGEGP